MDLDAITDADILGWIIGVTIAIVVALLTIRVIQHFYHKRRAEIEQKRVDRTKRIYFPW
jgi:hypothetical protein